MTDLPPFDDADLFDEAGYLRLYPGIAQAMMQGMVRTAWEHFSQHGRAEGRQPNDVDPTFYLAAYPDVQHDLGRPPAAEDAAPHYILLGRARGYLPNATAPRPPNGAAMPSPFGGLWTDQANALDLIQARLDLGRITRKQAAMLRTFALEGIVWLDRPFDGDLARAVALIVTQAFTGMFPDLRFGAATRSAMPESWRSGLTLAPSALPEPWRPELTEEPVAALDPHMVSGKIRALLLDRAVTDFLALLFDAPPVLTASRADLRLAAPPERDVAWFGHSLPLQFVAVTFGLENSEDGPSLVWPGSHRLPDLLWADSEITLDEARRTARPGVDRALIGREAHVRDLLHGQEPRRLGYSLGRRMIRHANLIHAVAAPEPPAHHRLLTAWYCPSYVAPGYRETAGARLHQHDGVAFGSGVYPSLEPLD